MNGHSKDLKTNWKVCQKLCQQPVAKIILVCMLLQNILCTIQQSQVSYHFICPAPDFDDCISQGPKGRPLPMGVYKMSLYDDSDLSVSDLKMIQMKN